MLTKESVPIPSCAPKQLQTPPLSNIEISAEQVIKKLENLNISKAPGPDQIHPTILKHCRNSLTPALTLLFNTTLKVGRIPLDWKIAHVTPIHKKGSKSTPSNYRPVSLTSVTCKVLESLIREQLIFHLQSNNLISDKQHGFLSKRSCITNLLLATEEWSKNLDQSIPTDIIYLDFAKAFD